MVSSMRVLLKTKEEVLEITDGATGERVENGFQPNVINQL